MIHETDIPCSECGDAVDERAIPVRDLDIGLNTEEPVAVAECTSCSARYFPERTVQKLFEQVLSTRDGETLS